MAISDPECRKAKITGQNYQIPAGGGLSLLVRARGENLTKGANNALRY